MSEPIPSVAAAIAALPEPMRPRLERLWAQFEEKLPALALTAAQVDAEVLASLPTVWAGSEYVAQACVRDPALLFELAASGDLGRDYAGGDMAARVAAAVTDIDEKVADEATLGTTLRRLRRREMVRIIWRDLTGQAALMTVTGEMTALAEACLDAALDRLYAWQCAESGTPVNAAGEPQRLVVLGMGKLGAWELNLSSDIDLIFAYPEPGQTRREEGAAPGRETSNEEFFARLGRRLIKAIGEVTAEGYVFRVDMRLRPFGDSGPPVMHFDAMEHYYQVHGREWERYAMIKARVVAGDREAGKDLMERLRPFVYRRYLDFGAFESLREMKEMIAREVRRKDMEHNVKLGAGGIREIEFIAQAFQLIRGGRERALQERCVLRVLERLAADDYLPAYVVDELHAAYDFLRRTEHRLQAWSDQQTHVLPADEAGRLRLAWSMGFADWAGFSRELARHRQRVHAHFEQVFAAPQTQHAESDGLDLAGVWLGQFSPEQAELQLAQAGYHEPAESLRFIELLRNSRSYRALSAQGRTRMDQLMPLLIGAAGAVTALQGGENASPDVTLRRVLDLLEAIARRTAYLALLVEHPMALSQLVRLLGASPWLARYLSQHPLLLDELLDPRSLYRALDKPALVAALRERLGGLAPAATPGEGEALEQQMDALRHFKQTQVLRVAAADLGEVLPVMQVSDKLTWIAEAVLDEVLELAWQHLVARHGRPVCTAEGALCDKGFAIVAYGKLGGIELGYGSDLDLVFLHGAEQEQAETSGEKPIALPVFFARLGQRIIHILTARTPAGELYEVDMRLRPSGESGLLVSAMRSYATYQREQAWTWEHQALVRARVVAGDPVIAEHFASLRREILARRRDREVLRGEVRDMRRRMREANDRSRPATDKTGDGEPGRFDIKQGRGGIADIEFMVQYGVLSWACDHPSLLEYTDTIRLLEALAGVGVMPAAEATLLAEAYQAYRTRLHRLTLQEQSAVVSDEAFRPYRDEVGRLWDALMQDA